MFLKYSSLKLEGRILTGRDIISYCRDGRREVFIPIADFMEDWLDPSPEIQLKTSGSTGTPKTITVRKDQLLASAAMTADFFGFIKGQKALLCLPVEYIAGKMMIVRALYSGLDLMVVNPSSNPLASLSAGIKIDFAAMIPMQLHTVKDLPGLMQIDTLLLGGGPVDTNLENSVSKLPLHIYHGYGMTETFGHIALRKINGKDASPVFKALKGVTLDRDSRGCLIIHAPTLIDSPLITNDVVELFSQKEFIWKGRFDHVVISGGIKIFPEELERKLQTVLTRRFYFTGLQDVKLGQKLVMIIEGEVMEKAELEDLKLQMKIVFNKFELPREIRFAKKFNETGSGKIRRI